MARTPGLLGSAVTLLVVLLQAVSGDRKTLCYRSDDSSQSLYDFSLMDVHGERTVNLSSYTNQQEPGANGTEILNMLKYVRPGNGFEPAFQLLEKTEVNGDNEHPLYTYLKAYCPPVQEIFNTVGPGLFYSPYKNSDVRWNFEKFLINKKGQPVLRYHKNVPFEDIRKDIEDMLAERKINNTSAFF